MFLAAGAGTRLRPLTDHLPKCMAPVHGKPLLEHNLVWARQFGFAEVTINLHFLPDVVPDYFGDGSRWGVKIDYSYEPELLGTAGAVGSLREQFDQTFCVWYGDNLSTCRLDRLLARHRACGGAATLALHRRETVTASGMVDFGPDWRIQRFVEKPSPEQVTSHWVNAAIYLLEPVVLEYIPRQGASDFGRQVFPALLAAGAPLVAYCLGEDEALWWIDTPQDYQNLLSAFRPANAPTAMEPE